ncbi:MAG: HAMP domain-containing protein [Magnetococcales bacterium]|nr:HAMP domain-containing protein [Magnetococcales bacterium]
MKNLKLATLLTLGFGGVLLLLLMISGASYTGLSTAIQGFVNYRSLASHKELAGQLQTNMLMIRIDAAEFHFNSSQESIVSYQKNLATMIQLLGEAKKVLVQPGQLNAVANLEQSIQEYGQGFDFIIQFNQEMNTLVADSLDPSSLAMRTTLTNLIKMLLDTRDTNSAYYVGQVQENLLLGLLSSAKFLVRDRAEDADMVEQKLQVAIKPLIETLGRELEYSEPALALLKTFVAERDAYYTAFQRVKQLLDQRNDIQHNALEQIGQVVAKAVDELNLVLKNDQDALGIRVQTGNQTVIMLVLSVSLVAILLGMLCAWYITRIVEVPLVKGVVLAQQVAAGDLTATIDVDQGGELGQLVTALKEMMAKLRAIVGRVSAAAEQVATASQIFSEGNRELATRTEKQASALEETSAAVEELTATVQQNADNANQAYQISKEAKAIANAADLELQATVLKTRSSNQAIAAQIQQANQHFFKQVQETSRDTVNVMDGISSSSRKISGITSVINDLAFQTNLLAINAAIEAARAGEHGRGFAVVAMEVRKLASRSARAAKEIGLLIQNNIEQILAGVQTADQASQSLAVLQQEIAAKLGDMEEELGRSLSHLGEHVTVHLAHITESVTKVSDMVENISAASMEQAEGIRQVNIAVTEMEKITHQNAVLADDAAVTSQTLVDQVQTLLTDVRHFRMDKSGMTESGPPTDGQDGLFGHAGEQNGAEEQAAEQGEPTWKGSKPDFE